MTIVAWIILVACGLITLHGILRILRGLSLNWFHAMFWLICTVLAAIAAGVIWGGLLIG